MLGMNQGRIPSWQAKLLRDEGSRRLFYVGMTHEKTDAKKRCTLSIQVFQKIFMEVDLKKALQIRSRNYLN
jgi:superfamily I DNA/RNA helicase